MKMSRILVIALAAFVFSGQAHAIAVNPSPLGTLGTPLVAGESGNYSLGALQYGNLVDTLGGYIDAKTQISITYSYSGLNPTFLSIDATEANKLGHTTVSVGAVSFPKFTVLPLDSFSTSPGLPLLATANLTSETGTVVLQNLYSTAASFSSIFKAFVFANGGDLNIAYTVSAIPLPPAFMLFLIGLMSFAGFGMYKKAHNKA